MYIAVAGNIGCGKTTLVEKLTQRYGWKPFYENINNPYLDDFYKDMITWSFKLQIGFLANKVTQMRQMSEESCTVIQDRTVYEEAEVFVRNLRNMALMSERDYQTYMRVYNLMVEKKTRPDLLIYLRGSVESLVGQIKKRGREYEQNIQTDYLESLNELYNNWIENNYDGNKLTIDIDNLDFVGSEDDFMLLIELIEKKLSSLGIEVEAR